MFGRTPELFRSGRRKNDHRHANAFGPVPEIFRSGKRTNDHRDSSTFGPVPEIFRSGNNKNTTSSSTPELFRGNLSIGSTLIGPIPEIFRGSKGIDPDQDHHQHASSSERSKSNPQTSPSIPSIQVQPLTPTQQRTAQTHLQENIQDKKLKIHQRYLQLTKIYQEEKASPRFKKMLEAEDSPINPVLTLDYFTQSLLFLVITNNDLPTLQLLLKKGINLNQSVYNIKPLDVAIDRKKIDMIHLLIEHGVNPCRDQLQQLQNLYFDTKNIKLCKPLLKNLLNYKFISISSDEKIILNEAIDRLDYDSVKFQQLTALFDYCLMRSPENKYVLTRNFFKFHPIFSREQKLTAAIQLLIDILKDKQITLPMAAQYGRLGEICKKWAVVSPAAQCRI